ncbi:hypothetical protein [Flectobacillus major]|uniref:hypothetical protein n=1 Tax=Flectobacillus major TaxID=103 RepID=UPI001182E849|nr:hypothetical protein [Flectobacillus major]
MEYLLRFTFSFQVILSFRFMVQQDAQTIKSIVEIGTSVMVIFSITVIVLVYVLHNRLAKQKFGL